MRRLALIALVLVTAGTMTGGALAYFAAHATGMAKFHIADAGTLTLAVDPIVGQLTPGGSLAVSFTVSNGTAWQYRAARVEGDDPLVTDLPDGCPARLFDFAPVKLGATLDPGEQVSGKGELTLAKGAPAECAGADPVLHLQVS